MGYDPEIHHRRSIRLRGYDYSRPGKYFVTICTYAKAHLFGDVVEGEMKTNEVGELVRLHWQDLPRHYPQVRLGSFVVMPNHIHGIIEIVGADLRTGRETVGAGLKTDPQTNAPPIGAVGAGLKTRPYKLSEVVRGFKTYSARRINEIRGTPGCAIWQRNYYEHIVRNDRELEIIRDYIATNSLRWAVDRENIMP